MPAGLAVQLATDVSQAAGTCEFARPEGRTGPGLRGGSLASAPSAAVRFARRRRDCRNTEAHCFAVLGAVASRSWVVTTSSPIFFPITLAASVEKR